MRPITIRRVSAVVHALLVSVAAAGVALGADGPKGTLAYTDCFQPSPPVSVFCYSDIFLFNLADHTKVRLSGGNFTSNSTDPSWTRDGRRLAFASDRDWRYAADPKRFLDEGHVYELYAMDADGKNVVRLTKDERVNILPSWSPDGKKIAFASYLDHEAQISVLNIATGRERQLTHKSFNQYPSWSPDGKSIAFLSGRDGDCGLYVMDADGGRQRRLDHRVNKACGFRHNAISYDGPDHWIPIWSPDSKRLLFVYADQDPWQAPKPGKWVDDLWAIAADGSGPRRLTHESDDMDYVGGGYMTSWPTWKADGRQAAFMAGGQPRWLKAPGTAAESIDMQATRAAHLAWRPESR